MTLRGMRVTRRLVVLESRMISASADVHRRRIVCFTGAFSVGAEIWRLVIERQPVRAVSETEFVEFVQTVFFEGYTATHPHTFYTVAVTGARSGNDVSILAGSAGQLWGGGG